MQFPGFKGYDITTIVFLPSLLYDSRTMELVDERPENLAQHDHGYDIATRATPLLSALHEQHLQEALSPFSSKIRKSLLKCCKMKTVSRAGNGSTDRGVAPTPKSPVYQKALKHYTIFSASSSSSSTLNSLSPWLNCSSSLFLRNLWSAP